MAAKRLLNLSPWTKLGIGLAAASGMAASAVVEYGQEKDKDQFSTLPWGISHSRRAWHKIRDDIRTTFEEPSQPVLLPPPLNAAYGQTPYTLVVELNGVLVHPEWTYRTGWRFKKRPYIDYFLKQCGPPMFEIVIYTQDQGYTAYPLIDGLDPEGYISYRLFKDSTKYIKGTHVKELNQLGRDMNRVIHLDWNADACQTSRNNCLILPKWNGSSNDKTLVELSDFIREIASLGVEDVRPVLDHYAQFSDPIEAFKEKRRRLEETNAKSTSLPAWKFLPGKAI